jgi:serine kinase of HPr protein (carbohydrate metabolism regulator)
LDTRKEIKMGLKIKYLEEETPVYDITVEDNHNFFANGILVHNCQEITLPTKPLNHIDDIGETEKRKVKVKKSDVEKYKEFKKSLGGHLYDKKQKRRL